MPTFRSATTMAWPAGRATKTSVMPATTKYGAARKSTESASAGIRSSLKRSFTASAIHWKKPPTPTRFGPMRLWMRPATRRSYQEKMPPEMAAKVNMTMPARNRATA